MSKHFISRLHQFALVLVGPLVLLAACSKPAPTEEPVRAVRVMTVGASSLQSSGEFAGEVRPRVESRLGFRVAGKLIKRQVESGQRVKAGQVLAQLDPQDYQLAVDAAQAQLGAAVTNRDLAGADFKRFKELRDQNFISSAELERREAALKAAQAQVDQAQAQLTAQRNQGSYANLVADAAGVVTAVEAEPGQVVSAGTPVVRIAQDGPRDAVFSVSEDKVSAIRLGAPVEVRVWPGQTVLAGKVREVSASADPVTRTYLVKVAAGTNRAAFGRHRDGAAAGLASGGRSGHQTADQCVAPGWQDHGRLGAGPRQHDREVAAGADCHRRRQRSCRGRRPGARHAGGVRRGARALARAEGHDIYRKSGLSSFRTCADSYQFCSWSSACADRRIRQQVRRP